MITNRHKSDATLYLLSAVILCAVICRWWQACSGEAAAQDGPTRADLVLARCLVAESDGNVPDYAPILAVLRTRAGRVGAKVEDVARRYCAALHVHRPSRRQEAILGLPGGAGMAQWGGAFSRALEAVRAEPGPVCGGANVSQWAGWADHASPSWSQAYCGPQCPVPVHGRHVGWEPGCVANRFFVEHGRVIRR